MKLHTLYEVDNSFQNVEHNSEADYVKALNNKITSLSKEKEHISDQILKMGVIHGTPATHPEYAAKMNKLTKKRDTILTKIAQAKKDKLMLKNADVFKILDTHKAEADRNRFSPSIPNPTKLAMSQGGKALVENPTHSGNATQVFWGRPWDFPWWTDKRLQEYKNYSKLLERNNKSGFTRMYAAIYHGQYLNFVMIGDDGNFVWRVYDVGGGSGQNWIFANGNKTQASIFTNIKTPKEQDKIYNNLYNGNP